jgi:hypothetical protein
MSAGDEKFLIVVNENTGAVVDAIALHTAISTSPPWAARCREVLLLSAASGFCRKPGLLSRMRCTKARSFWTTALRSLDCTASLGVELDPKETDTRGYSLLDHNGCCD